LENKTGGNAPKQTGDEKMKKWQVVTSVVVALVAVLSLSVAAFAQGNQPPVAPQGYGRGPAGNGMYTNGPQGQMAGYGFRFGANGESLVNITAQVTGLKIEDVVKELQAGKTFADVAQANGKTAADLVNAFLADRKAVLDKAVADGRLTQTAADTLLSTMKTNVEQHVNSTWEPRGMGYRFTGQQPTQPQFLGPRWNR
jgi:hypothetical protein